MNGFEIINPATGEVVASRQFADPGLIEKTLSRSEASRKAWKNTPVPERARICSKAASYFQDHIDELSKELTLQMGRPIRYSPLEIKGGFLERAEYMISIAEETLADTNVSDKSGFQRFIRKEPLGTVLVLAPWNYPYLTSVNAVIPAILAGNTVILKHATQTALCAERYIEAFRFAGLPDGVFQYLHMSHDQVGEVLADPRISYTAFTGSVEGGRAVQMAIGPRFIRTGMELGGKDPAYVTEDADLTGAVENLVDGSFFNSGQSCCGIERIYVRKEVFDQFVTEFVELTKSYALGDPMDPETTIGPMVRVRNAESVIAQLNQAVEMGARKHIEPTHFPDLPLPFLAPQVLTEVNHRMDIMREETFGPVVGIMSVENDAEAVKMMNDSRYGLTASIWTQDMDRAFEIGNLVETGTWFMNRCDYLDPELAWTGVKDSGMGCTLSRLGYENLTRPKSFHLKKS